MDPLEIAAQLRREADAILYDRGFDAILRPHGEVSYTGSYALDLMVWPDLDAYVILPPDTDWLGPFFEIGSGFARIPGVYRMNFRNCFVKPIRDDFPVGLYWGVRLITADRPIPWKIDVWGVDAAPVETNRLWMEKAREKLDDETRRLILEVKISLVNAEGRTPIQSGFHICEAVLFRGLREPDAIRAYLRERGVEGI